MPRSDLCEIVVVLDRSGSMGGIARDMEGGFNKFMDDQKQAPGECVVTLVQFDTAMGPRGHGPKIETVYAGVSLAEVPPLSLVPRGGTPLLDAVGQTIVDVGQRLAALDEAQRPGKVLVLIITDGEENSSREYRLERVKELVERQTTTYGWAFAYLGANVDAFAEAGGMGILRNAAAQFSPDSAGVAAAFDSSSASARHYRGGGAYEVPEEDRAKMDATGDASGVRTGGA